MNLAADLFERAFSDKTAFVFTDVRLSRGDLRDRMLATASGLHGAGVRPGDRVALQLPNGPEFASAWLALQWIGAVAVQLPPVYRRREIAQVLADSGASTVLSPGSPLLDMTATASGPPPAYQACDAATLTYISTEEGPMRGVVQTAADVVATFDAYARGVLKLAADDVCAGALGFGWAYGFGALLAFPLLAHCTAVIADNLESLLMSVDRHAATILFAVPTTYRMLLRHPMLDRRLLRSLRCCVSAGEALPADVADEWRRRAGVEILDGLGTTELTHIVISTRPGEARGGFVGRPVDGYEARIVDADGRPLPDGQPGLLAISGPTRARYWSDRRAELSAFQNGWTYTGDIAVRHSGGWIQHVRRADSLIVSGGHKVSIREVENALADHPDVANARVEGKPDAMRGAVVHASVTPARGADCRTLAERLREYLKAELAAFKCPRTIEID